MALDKTVEEKFAFIAELIAIEASIKLSSILNRNVNLTYSRLIDTIISDKIVVKRDAYLISVPSSGSLQGPISIIASNEQVFCIADLAMGGDGNASDDVIPDETNQMVFAETINTVVVSIFERLKTLKDDFDVQTGDHEFRFLQSIKDASLSVPEGTENSTGLGFKVKIAAKLDGPLHVEVNEALVETLVAEFSEIAETVDLNVLEQKIKQEYNSDQSGSEEEETGQVVEDIALDDQSAYQVNVGRNLGFLSDISLELIVELGRSEMMMKDVLKLTKGSAIELDKHCNESVDLYVHNQLVARGEVVAIDDCFGLKITELLGHTNLVKEIKLLEKIVS